MKPLRLAALVGLVAMLSLVVVGCNTQSKQCGYDRTTKSGQAFLGGYDQDELDVTFVNNTCNTIHACLTGPGDVDPKKGVDIPAGKSKHIETHVFAKDLPYTYSWTAGDQSGQICLNKNEEIHRTICIGTPMAPEARVGVGSACPTPTPTCPTATPTCPPAAKTGCEVKPACP